MSVPDPDGFPDPMAHLDQTLRGQRDIAKLIRNHYVSLMAEGFDEAEAYALTIAYQGVILRVDHGPE
jgi:hypothetical protein